MSGEGWTVDGVLRWIETEPDLEIQNPIDRETLLEYILKGNYEAYLDMGKGRAYFDQAPFQKMLERVKALSLGSETDRYGNPLAVDSEKTYLLNNWINSINDLAENEALYGEKLVAKGFPSDQGGGKTFLQFTTTLCITSGSHHKDGAYEFLEYVLLYPWYSIEYGKQLEEEKGMERTTKGTIWSLKSLYEEEMIASCGERIVSYNKYNTAEVIDPERIESWGELRYQVTEEHGEQMKDLLAIAEMDTQQKKQVRSIVLEEIQPYFLDQKSLEETCETIQRRVQLLLDEGA